MGPKGRSKIVAPAPVERRVGLKFCMQNHEGCAGKTKSIGKLRDGSERTYQHPNFMDSGVIRKDEGRRREERTPAGMSRRGRISKNKKRRLPVPAQINNINRTSPINRTRDFIGEDRWLELWKPCGRKAQAAT